MYTIRTLNKIAPRGLDLLSRDRYETASEIARPDAILLRSYRLSEEEITEGVRAIARAGAGVNNIPVDHCTERGIVVFNTPGANADSVKELVLAGLFLSSRLIVESVEWARSLSDRDDEVPRLVEKEKSRFAGPEIGGKRLGVIGLGAIGVKVANAALSLGMEVTGYDPFISVEAAWGLSSEVRKAENLDQLLSRSDYVTLHVPLNDKTRGLLNADRLALLPEGARILNFARGGLVENEALLAALEEGRIGRYVTDFPDASLVRHPGVLPIPHLGASTPEAEENCAVMAAEQLREYLETGNINRSVNFPTCRMESTGRTRILIANRNIPNMLSQVLAGLADDGYNVEDMVNRHRDAIAYNIIDIDAEDLPEGVEDRLKAIEGVVMTRVIPGRE